MKNTSPHGAAAKRPKKQASSNAAELFAKGRAIIAASAAPKPSETNNKGHEAYSYADGHPAREGSSLPWEDDDQIEQQLPMAIAEIAEELKSLNPARLLRVRQYIRIECHESGCTTPAENLIVGLVYRYRYGITPEDLERELDRTNTDSFRLNFEEALEEAQHFHKMYPKLMAGGVA